MNSSLPAAIRADINPASVSAGLTAILFYAFGPIPIFLSVAGALSLSLGAASSWFFMIFLTSGISSIILSIRYRQPIAMGWSLPGLVFLGTAGVGYRFPVIVGASLAAGVVILVLGLAGVGERIMHWLPLPLVLGMFAGSVLHYMPQIFEQLGSQPAIVGGALLGFLVTCSLNRRWLPPLGGAALAGFTAAGITGRLNPEAFRWEAPTIALVRPEFDPGSMLTLALPLTIMAIGIGNVQGIGMLISQGYRPPVNLLTVAVGITSVVNALFGGHPGTVQRNGVAILAGDDAGPHEQRYVASVIAGVGCLLIALMATSASTLLTVIPASLVITLAGLAIMRTLMDALKKSLEADIPVGAFFAFAIAASPLTILGIGSAFWALLGGYIVSLITERAALEKSLQ